MNTAVDIMGPRWFAVFAVWQTAPATIDLNTHCGVGFGRRTQWDEHRGEWPLFKYVVPELYMCIMVFTLYWLLFIQALTLKNLK